jgi:hypothetical protein
MNACAPFEGWKEFCRKEDGYGIITFEGINVGQNIVASSNAVKLGQYYTNEANGQKVSTIPTC